MRGCVDISAMYICRQTSHRHSRMGWRHELAVGLDRGPRDGEIAVRIDHGGAQYRTAQAADGDGRADLTRAGQSRAIARHGADGRKRRGQVRRDDGGVRRSIFLRIGLRNEAPGV